MFDRVAIYHVPGGDLGVLGARWLGWDIRRGCASPAPGGSNPEREKATARPRRYGLHATIKPPFRLADPGALAALAEAAADLCAGLAPVTLRGLRLDRMGRFLALLPEGGAEGLSALAARVVADLDRFRAPPGAAELQRRNRARLSPSQRDNLRRWGYPHVMADFRFHITLTGPLEDSVAARIQARLRPHLATLAQRPYPVDSLSLAGADRDGHFHEIERFSLGRPA